MQASIRELKAHLSEYIRQVIAGETVTISVHNRPVAQIVPIKKQATLDDLAAQPASHGTAARRSAFREAEKLPVGVNLSDWGCRGSALILYLDTSAWVKLTCKRLVPRVARLHRQSGNAGGISRRLPGSARHIRPHQGAGHFTEAKHYQTARAIKPRLGKHAAHRIGSGTDT